ncbi:MAG: Ig domain-containing protein [Faecalibacterium sp.]
MNLSAKKLALSAMLLCLLTLGATLPASASFRMPWDKPAESIEPGAYSAVMEVGQTQQLAPALFPENSNSKIKYTSDNAAVLAVSSTGEVQALDVGVANVTAAADDVSCVYTIQVQPNASMIVAEMDLTLSANRIGVGENASLSIQVLPTSAASYAELVLTSSNEAVATVNNFGKVTGIAPGTATITASCGNVSASAKITVVDVSGDTVQKLTLNTTYVVLKPGASKTLQVSVSPSSASKKFTFTSNDTKVAKVSSSGVITAVGTGATSVLVSNGTATASVTVIVNQTASSTGSGTEGSQDPGAEEETSDPVLDAIRQSKEYTIRFAQNEVPVVTSEMLNALRLSGKTLCVTAENYTLRVNGTDVRSTTNAFSTNILFTPAEKGLELSFDQETILPGNVQIELHGDAESYQRLYLYNASKGRWQYLDSYQNGVVTVDSAGRYLLTNETISLIEVNWYLLGAAGVVIVVIAIAYILVKKRYWFW